MTKLDKFSLVAGWVSLCWGAASLAGWNGVLIANGAFLVAIALWRPPA